MILPNFLAQTNNPCIFALLFELRLQENVGKFLPLFVYWLDGDNLLVFIFVQITSLAFSLASSTNDLSSLLANRRLSLWITLLQHIWYFMSSQFSTTQHFFSTSEDNIIFCSQQQLEKTILLHYFQCHKWCNSDNEGLLL